ncbi:hypothetical protein PMAYCL1PPCAC_07725, partial [Pristionchus mayeri]
RKMFRRRVRILVTLARYNSSFTPKRIDTVPAFLHSHLFGTPTPSTSVENEEIARLKLPKLHGENLETHFRSIANQQIAAYRDLLESVEHWKDLPSRPKEWTRREGWTRYGRDGTETEQVPYPLEDVFLYDVETCVVEGQLPTMTIALSQNSWYLWCSPRLADPDTVPVPTFPDQHYLIPLGGEERPRIAIGHNVAYDRVRAREPYNRKQSLLRFWDTMSMSIPIIGMADHQLLLYESNDIGVGEREKWRETWKRGVSRNSLAAVYEFFTGNTMNKAFQKFFVKEPMTAIVAEFQRLSTYCADDVLITHQIYNKLMPLYRKHFPHPATMAGVLHMSEAYLPINQFWRMFFEKSEEDRTEVSRSAVSAVVEAARERLQKHDPSTPDVFMWADKWSKKSAKTDMPSWLIDLFSDASTAASVKEGSYDLGKVASGVKMKSNIIPRLFGLCYGPYPLHHRVDHGWGFLVPNKDAAKEGIKLTLKNKETAVFPSKEIRTLVNSQSMEFGNPVILDAHAKRKVKGDLGDCTFYQLPHPDGKGNVGFPIGKGFMADIKEKVIRATRHEDLFEAYVQSIQTTTFWTSFRERYSEELPIWYNGEREENETVRMADRENTVVKLEGAIVPAICPAGTVSRRSVHRLWVTATNASEDSRIGTGLKSMVQAHSGSLFVGADVDSQEQWIAGLYGDASASERLAPSDRSPGCTPFSNMMLAGSKSDNSDLHTVIARDMGISRGAAKVLNYARLYGAGEKHSVEELEKSGVKREEAELKARKLFTLTKGDKRRYLQLKRSINAFFDKFLQEMKEKIGISEDVHLLISGCYFIPVYGEKGCCSKLTIAFEDWIAAEFVKRTGREQVASSSDLHRVISAIYEDESMNGVMALYSGGYESDTFNFLEFAATRKEIRTPVLGALLGSSLSPLPEDTEDRQHFSSKYKRSVINWMVQSSAVDFLHLLLVCLEHLAMEYDIDARFSISIHDEVRYVVSQKDADRFALALMFANMYVRAFISQRVGIYQLPMTCAFFSQVDVDSVLRKEVDSRCVNPDGSVVQSGRALTISDVIKATGGSLEKN